MAKPRVHLRNRFARAENAKEDWMRRQIAAGKFPECRIIGVENITEDQSQVTCLFCLKRLKQPILEL